MKKQSPPYSILSKIYDYMGASQHSVKMTEYCRRLFYHFGIKPQCGLDLCCGTGTALEIFHKQGIEMAGLDRCEGMLAIARKKLKGTGIRLYQAELPGFKLTLGKGRKESIAFDLVTCFYDSLNYLKSERDLKTAFKAVADHLQPGGWFIFDMNTYHGLSTCWSGSTFADAWEDLVWVWKSEFDTKKKAATLVATCVVKEGQGWKRFDEVHVEYAYSNATIARLLRESGFVVKGRFKCFTLDNADKETNRICLVGRKR